MTGHGFNGAVGWIHPEGLRAAFTRFKTQPCFRKCCSSVPRFIRRDRFTLGIGRHGTQAVFPAVGKNQRDCGIPSSGGAV